MTLGLIFLMSLATVAGALLLLLRTIGLRRTLRYATAIDVIFTTVICLALAGTLTGLLIGIVAGLVMTGVLTVLKAMSRSVASLRDSVEQAQRSSNDNWCPGGSPNAL